MFFWEILKSGLLAEIPEQMVARADYVWPQEVALVHQALGQQICNGVMQCHELSWSLCGFQQWGPRHRLT